MDKEAFVFRDIQGYRWARVQLALVFTAVCFFIGVVVFIRALLVTPKLERLAQVRDLSAHLNAQISEFERTHVPEHPPSWLTGGGGESASDDLPVTKKSIRFQKEEQLASDLSQSSSQEATLSSKSADTLQQRAEQFKAVSQTVTHARPIRLGFYARWDNASRQSFRANATMLTHVASEMFVIKGMPPQLVFTNDERLAEQARAQDVGLLPLLTNLENDTWHPEAVETLARMSRGEQGAFIQVLAERLVRMGAEGLLIDWEHLDPTYREEIARLLGVFAEVLHSNGLTLWLCIPVGNDIKAYDLDLLATFLDHFVAMLYDETGEQDDPGPISSLAWFEEWLRVLLEHGSADQWVVGLGAYGYDWKTKGATGASYGRQSVATISFFDAMARASYSDVLPIENKEPFDGFHFEYTDSGEPHEIWFLDAISFRNQKEIAEKRGVSGLALYRLGTEDPKVWETLKCVNSCEPASFTLIRPTSVLSDMGAGDFLTLSDKQGNGLRTIRQSERGIWSAGYVTFPRPAMIYHQGQKSNDQVAITFDDGPEPEWTEPILDILREKKVKAAFFITGNKAADYPKLVQQIYRDGHELGNHTYSHGDLGKMSLARVELELNSTQRLIESIVDHSTLLFRAPYNADRHPQTLTEFRMLLMAQNLGYLPVSASVDTEDWKTDSAERVFELVRERRSLGNVILMHDAGGDRSATVKALPQIIDYLRARGDEIVTLAQLLGVPREVLLTEAKGNEPNNTRFITATGFRVAYAIEELVWAFMIVGASLVVLRTMVVLILSLFHKLRCNITELPESKQPVSVIIAAFNEEKVIAKTLQGIIMSNYPGDLEIVVIDDGSTDDTCRIVSEFARNEPRLKVYSQENRGKAEALRVALRRTRHELVVMLDADTVFEQGTISELVKAIEPANIGAVSGHAKVGNRKTLIGKFQDLEYTCGFNLDRRAYDVLGCVTVVPGAVSAFRRSSIIKAGGISTDTLAEDTDLTLALHKSGYRIRYAPRAIAWTEAPEAVGALIKQRKRWAFGTLQCLWKHRDLLFSFKHPALGFFSIPSAWFCHILLVAMIPFVDLFLLLSLSTGVGMEVIDFALAFLLLDLVLSFAACLMEGTPLVLAWLVLPMRIVYRPLLSFAVWSSIVRALRGALVGWGKLERCGSVPDGTESAAHVLH